MCRINFWRKKERKKRKKNMNKNNNNKKKKRNKYNMSPKLRLGDIMILFVLPYIKSPVTFETNAISVFRSSVYRSSKAMFDCTYKQN